MKLPAIDLTKLPDLESLTGLYGSMRTPGSDDSIVIMATIVYDVSPPGGGLI